MRLLIFLGTIAIALPFVISGVAMPFGNAVSARFLERPTQNKAVKFTIPNETTAAPPLDAENLSNWVSNNGMSAEGYSTRVILLDVLYLFFLGGFLAFASATLSGMVRWPTSLSSVPVWIWCALPIIYIFADFAEDSLIFILLRWPPTILDTNMKILGFLTGIKIKTVTLSIIQVLVLCLASYVAPSGP